MELAPIIDAASGMTCACCGRTHRKLSLVDGRYVGESCADNIRMAKRLGIAVLAGYSPRAAARVAAFIGGQRA